MFHGFSQLMPPEAAKLTLAFILSFLIGLEREEHKTGAGGSTFGGVRTFPLIGLLGFALAEFAPTSAGPMMVGFAVVGAFLWLSYQHKIQRAEAAGATTEVSGLTTFVVGALV
ncbi:MAG: MgtC/SapB family protein, partial [Candidatus Acidiferrales bacterium]